MEKDFQDVKSTGKPLHTNSLGGNRDSAEDKLDYTLLPIPALKRVVRHYMNGLKKYGRDNWKKLSLPEDIERYKQSMFRHMMQYLSGECDEDHLAAVVWNALSLLYFEEAGSLRAKMASLASLLGNHFKNMPRTITDRDTGMVFHIGGYVGNHQKGDEHSIKPDIIR